MTAGNPARQEMSPDDSAYLALQAQGWAWEWLRRSQDYATDVDAIPRAKRTVVREEPELLVIEAPSTPPPERWHLRLLEDADCYYGNGAVFWDSRIDAGVLPVTASSVRAGSIQNDAIDFHQFNLQVQILRTIGGEEHVLLSDGIRSIQLHVVDGTVLEGPVRLAHAMTGSARPHSQFLTIERLAALRALRRFPLELFPPDPRASRWLLALKAYDMARMGISLRQISEKLYEDAIVMTPVGAKSDWPKSRVRRLLTMAEKLANGGYRNILSE